jgi:hypothetical protein
MIPDYVDNVYNIHGTLAAQALDTQNYWQDSVAKRFYEKFIDEYEKKVNLYINGRDGSDYITGKGLNDLLVFFDEKENEMANLM